MSNTTHSQGPTPDHTTMGTERDLPTACRNLQPDPYLHGSMSVDMTSHPIHKLEQQVKELILWDNQQYSPTLETISLSFWNHLKEAITSRHPGKPSKPFILAIGGPSGSGKSQLRSLIEEAFQPLMEVSSFSQDNYYRNFAEDFPGIPVSEFYHWIDLDDPEHFRFDLMARDLRQIQSQPLWSSFQLPKLVYGTPSTKPTLDPDGIQTRVTPLIITEGIHAFHDPRVCQQYHLKIFMDISETTRRKRWIERNNQENRGTTDNMWNTTVNCLEEFISPTRHHADLILNNDIDLVQLKDFVHRIRDLMAPLLERSIDPLLTTPYFNRSQGVKAS